MTDTDFPLLQVRNSLRRAAGIGGPARRVLRVRVVLACAAVALGIGAAAFAQSGTAAPDVGLIVYTVRADRADAVDAVLRRVAEALRAPGGIESPAPAAGLKILRSLPQGAGEDTLFILLFEPPLARGGSLEQLVAASVPEGAEDLIAQWRDALGGALPFTADLRTLHSVSPADALRSRLEGLLAREGVVAGVPAGTAAVDSREERERLERLQLPAWSVGPVEFRIVDRTTSEWRLSWSFELVNVSPLGPANTDIVIEFRNRNGALLAASRSSAYGLGTGERHNVTGETRIPAAAASTIATVTARVEPRTR